MKLSLALLAAAAPALASGKRLKAISPDTDLSNVQIHAQSKAGNRLLSKARRLDNGDDAMTWVAGYSLKFHSCTSSQDYYGGQFANNDGDNANNYNYQYNGDNNGQYNQDGQYNANAYGDNGDGNNYNGNGYYNNEQRNDYQGMYAQKVVHFKLCPSDSCFRCKNGADYVVELSEFVDAYLESKMTSLEYQCERVRENCWCENANSQEECEYGCYKNAGMQECADAMVEDENAFDVQEAVECSQLEVDEEAVENYYLAQNYYSTGYNQNGNYNQNGQGGQDEDHKVYVGPYCSKNGKSIHLGLFSEETCSFPAPDGLYEAINYGSSLPYAKKSMVNSGCITCKAPSENDNQNQNNYYENQEQEAPEVADVCSSLYEVAGKCEEGLDGYFPYRDVSGCGYIKSLKESVLYVPQVNMTAKVFAGIFAVTTAALGALSLVLYRRSQRQNVSLAGSAIIS